MEKTSKVKSIGKITKRTNPQNQKDIYYHNMVMENGDTISLGKQKEGAFTVGQEITYIEETKSDGKKKYKEFRKQWKGGTGVTNSQIAFLGACILSTAHPDKKLGELVDLLKKEIEKYS